MTLMPGCRVDCCLCSMARSLAHQTRVGSPQYWLHLLQQKRLRSRPVTHASLLRRSPAGSCLLRLEVADSLVGAWPWEPAASNVPSVRALRASASCQLNLESGRESQTLEGHLPKRCFQCWAEKAVVCDPGECDSGGRWEDA